MGRYSHKGITFLCRLLASRGGNTLAIAAAALLPMMALIGGGVDISRSYMAKTQLQSACDAGVLAGRKAMSKTGVYDTAEKAKATKMFNFNFNSSALDARSVSYVTSVNSAGQVLGTATTTVPTLVMKIFKMDTVDLSVNCMAELQIGNADIMFVLDTTGSMLCAPEDTKTNCTQLSATNTTTKIWGLRDAVRDFHATIKSSVNDSRTRIRYGFVPYSQTVNVSDLLLDPTTPMPSDYLTSTTSYQSRVAEFSSSNPYVTAPWNANTPTNATPVTQTYSSNITQANCQTASSNYGNNKYPSGSAGTPVNGGGPATSGIATTVTTYAFLSWTKVSGTGTSALGTCKRTMNVATTTYTGTTWYQFTRWIYRSEPIDTSGFKTGASTKYGTITASTTAGSTSRVRVAGTYDLKQLADMVTAGTTANIGTSSTTWNGCIEERTSQTPSSTYDFDPIPDDAYDLNFDYEPDSDATRWRPMWPAVYVQPPSTTARNFYFNTSNGNYYTSSTFGTQTNPTTPPTTTASTNCPYKMELLKQVDLSSQSSDVNGTPAWLDTYLKALVAAGSTYHDIGMEWGGRLTSSTGIFADNVTKDADKISVSKHIIFMTDGIMEPSATTYSAYGVENYDHRIAPAGSESTITARHNARFAAVCDAIKAQGTTIWVVAFGTTMTTQLQNCASDGRAYYSSNTVALRNTFKFIAAQVADLRLGA